MFLIRKLRKGFTLIELVVVVIVLGILLGILVPSFFGATDSANVVAAKSAVSTAFKAARIAEANGGNSGRLASAGVYASAIEASEPELASQVAVVTSFAAGVKGNVDVCLNGTQLTIAEQASDGAGTWVYSVWNGTSTGTGVITTGATAPTC